MQASADVARIGYVGHATVRVEIEGVCLLTDPLLRNRVAHLRRAAAIEPDASRAVDAVLISHLHYDHLDFPSLQKLDREVLVVVPRGAGALIRRKGRVLNVSELEAGEQLKVGPVTVTATPAEHDRGRLPFGVRADPLGYVIEGAGRTVYFAGDTDVFGGMAGIPRPDVALLPIWGWGPSLGEGHMNPERAAEAAGLLQVPLAIPIHWGTYYPIHLGLGRTPAFLATPPAAFEREIRVHAPATEVRILQPGESTEI